MAFHIYDLTSCGTHPSILNITTGPNPSPYEGNIVYLTNGSDPSETYSVDIIAAGTVILYAQMPPITITNLLSCVDPNADKMYEVRNCFDQVTTREVLLPAAQNILDVLVFTGECSCWEVRKLISTYTESLTIAYTFTTPGHVCQQCLSFIAATVCTYEERTLGYAVKIGLPIPEPPDRGFAECCYSNLVFGDVADTDPYKNDYSSVFFQRQTDTDTVAFEIIPASTGVPVLLADITHGEEYFIDPTHNNPNLTWFRVDWRKILSVIGEDTYTIRKAVTIAGVGPTNIDSNSFILKPFSIARANHTVRIDGTQDGTLEKIDVDFKESGYKNALRVQGFFGDPQDNITQDNVVFSSKKGQSYYEDQITMSNDPDYTFQANNIPECISRELREFIIFANEIFISDYNLNNHSYRYELTPVVLEEVSSNEYPVLGRGVSINMTFKNRSKNNRKSNC
jgi:hypothetical protein